MVDRFDQLSGPFQHDVTATAYGMLRDPLEVNVRFNSSSVEKASGLLVPDSIGSGPCNGSGSPKAEKGGKRAPARRSEMGRRVLSGINRLSLRGGGVGAPKGSFPSEEATLPLGFKVG